jgi:hypothetical protein
MTAADLGHEGRQLARENRGWVQGAARLGYSARGLLYTVMGVLALQLATRRRQGETDKMGALQEIGSKPFGRALLIVLAIAFFAYAAWHLLEAVLNFERTGAAGRLFRVLRATLYFSLTWATLQLAITSKSGNGDEESKDFTAKVLSWRGGAALVVAVGLVWLALAAHSGRQATGGRYREHLNLAKMSAHEEEVIGVLARVGLFSRTIVFGAVALFFFQAAWTNDADKATGIDDALRRVATAPYGRVILAGLAAGLVAFGIWSFAEARYRRVMNQ